MQQQPIVCLKKLTAFYIAIYYVVQPNFLYIAFSSVKYMFNEKMKCSVNLRVGCHSSSKVIPIFETSTHVLRLHMKENTYLLSINRY